MFRRTSVIVLALLLLAGGGLWLYGQQSSETALELDSQQKIIEIPGQGRVVADQLIVEFSPEITDEIAERLLKNSCCSLLWSVPGGTAHLVGLKHRSGDNVTRLLSAIAELRSLRGVEQVDFHWADVQVTVDPMW